jgi:hypothetical protein
MNWRYIPVVLVFFMKKDLHVGFRIPPGTGKKINIREAID